jgi:hypothetical protein
MNGMGSFLVLSPDVVSLVFGGPSIAQSVEPPGGHSWATPLFPKFS